MNDVLTEFKRLGAKASFHYADDSCKEWDLAYGAEREALRLYDEHPELEDEMREIAGGFLWSLEWKRPPSMECPACGEIALRLSGSRQNKGQMWNDWRCTGCDHYEQSTGHWRQRSSSAAR